ncbi:MAG TPA: hypothetical protein VFG89_00410 [Coriobacteriia bacterium]|nr:hypothetical protein [Coriobacteriia bacterium]
MGTDRSHAATGDSAPSGTGETLTAAGRTTMGEIWFVSRWWSMRAVLQQSSTGAPHTNAEATGAVTRRTTAKQNAIRL